MSTALMLCKALAHVSEACNAKSVAERQTQKTPTWVVQVRPDYSGVAALGRWASTGFQGRNIIAVPADKKVL